MRDAGYFFVAAFRILYGPFLFPKNLLKRSMKSHPLADYFYSIMSSYNSGMWLRYGMVALRGMTLFLLLATHIQPTSANSNTDSDSHGVYQDRIVFGQSAVFEGPSAELGRGMRDGLLAAFGEANRAGGVHGRRLELLVLDDGYEPERAITNVDQLINKDRVFGIVGEVGTPTSRAVQPITTAAGVPFFGPFTGAEFLRDTSLRNVINVRASYNQETETWARYLVDNLGLNRIAVLYQDDSFGRAGLKGLRKALRERKLELVAEGTYMRNTTAVKRGLLTIRKAKPQAVAIVGAYQPSAEFIRIAHRLGLKPIFINISFVGSEALAVELGKAGKDVIVSQVVPLPEDPERLIVADYNRALVALDSQLEPSFVTLEGYLVGRLVVESLKATGREVTRKGLLDTIREVGEFDLSGLKLSFGPNDNQGLDEVFLTILNSEGRFESVKVSK